MAEIEKIGIERYIPCVDDKAPICREERQYALFLNNILMSIKCKVEGEKPLSEKEYDILTACELPKDAHIEHVFYEATFMRDFFENDRDNHENCEKCKGCEGCFNGKLLSYICGPFKKTFKETFKKDIPTVETEQLTAIKFAARKEKNGKGYNLGAKGGKNALKKYRVVSFIASVMMNVKPDIAVLYTKKAGQGESKYYLRFIECKYLSKESKYKDTPDECKNTTQRMVQNWVAQFLCGDNGLLNVNGINIEASEPSKLVCFKSSLNEGHSFPEDASIIEIKKLIELHEGLFESK